MNNIFKMPILIIGMGSIGRRHLRNLFSLGYKNIIGVASNKAKKKKIEKDFDIKLYSNPRLAFKKERPFATLICTPTHLHVPLANLAIDYDSHIFIEKPISHDLKGIDALIKKVEKKRVVAMVACNYRFNKGWVILQRALQSGLYGNPLFSRVALGYYLPTARKGVNYKNVYAAKRRGGGVILDSGSHVVDYMSELFGEIRGGVSVKSPFKSLGIENEETAHVVLKHASGITSAVSLDFVSRKPIHRVDVVTTEGLLAWDFRGDFITFEDGCRQKTLYKGAQDVNQMFVDEMRHFFQCIINGSKPLRSLRGAKHILKTLLQISCIK